MNNEELIKKIFEDNNICGIISFIEDSKEPLSDAPVLYDYRFRTGEDRNKVACSVNYAIIQYLISVYGPENLLKLVNKTIQDVEASKSGE